MDYWRMVYKFAWILLIIILPIGVACLFAPRCNSLRTLQAQKAQIAEENRRIEETTRELQSRQDRFVSDPLFVERVARESGMIKSNEVTFRSLSGDPAILEAPTNHTSADLRATPRPAVTTNRTGESSVRNRRRR